MKIFICATVALCVLVGGITCFCIQLDNLGDSLLKKADALEEKLFETDKQNAEALLSEMTKEWEKNTSLLMAFTEHSEINGVNDRLMGIKNSLIYNDFATAYRELSTFKHHISCIVRGSMPSLINIL